MLKGTSGSILLQDYARIQLEQSYGLLPQRYDNYNVSWSFLILVKQAGMFAIRARRKVASERDFLDAVEKVVRQGTKFSSTYVSLFFNEVIDNLLVDSGPCIKYTTRFVPFPLDIIIYFEIDGMSILDLNVLCSSEESMLGQSSTQILLPSPCP